MKKIIFVMLFALTSSAVFADDYAYLTFETTSGDKVSVSVDSSLTLSINGTTLTVGSESFTLTNLSKMYFSSTDETTGITSITADELAEVEAIYTLNGSKVSADQMEKGVYIVKTKGKTFKVIAK